MKRLLNYRMLTFAEAQMETRSDKEFLNIGPTPYSEDCTPAGRNLSDSIFECAVYIRQLIRYYGQPPDGCEFFTIKNVHEFGTYYDANIFYRIAEKSNEEQNGLSEEYAFRIENGMDYWDDISKEELVEGEHHLHIGKVISIKKSA